jgi:hypothetical protein
MAINPRNGGWDERGIQWCMFVTNKHITEEKREFLSLCVTVIWLVQKDTLSERESKKRAFLVVKGIFFHNVIIWPLLSQSLSKIIFYLSRKFSKLIFSKIGILVLCFLIYWKYINIYHVFLFILQICERSNRKISQFRQKKRVKSKIIFIENILIVN